jgi:uracil phosphoribosyltransferase
MITLVSEQKERKPLVVLEAFPSILYSDNADSKEWRKALRTVSHLVANEAMKGRDKKKLLVCYIWQAGLSFAFRFCNASVDRHLHIGLRRDDRLATEKNEIYLAPDKADLLGEFDKVIIADPLLLTGEAFLTAIEFLKKIGVPPEKMLIACTIASPDGIANIIKRYPEMDIITATLNNDLGQTKYAGVQNMDDRFFKDMDRSYFETIKEMFSSEEWPILKHLLEHAN